MPAAGEYPDGSRIFIGNLASEATSKKELRQIFEAYGPVDEIILHESYGFIQFHTPEAAASAIAAESGRPIGGRRIDVQLSKRDRNKDRGDDRRGGGRGRSPPRRDSFRENRRFDSPPRRESGYDRRPPSPDRRFSARDRGGPGQYGMERRYDEPRRDSARDRFDRPRSPGGYGSRDMMPRRDRSRSPHRRSMDEYSRRDPRFPSPPRRESGALPPRRAPDVCLLAANRDLRQYASFVINRISDSGIREVDIAFADRPIPAELNDMIARDVPFACVVGPKDESNRTVSISLLKRTPPEDIHGVPVEEALRILNKELMLYKEAQAEIARAKLAQQYPVQPIPPVHGQGPQQFVGMNGPMPGAMPPTMPQVGQLGMAPMQQPPMVNGGPLPMPGVAPPPAMAGVGGSNVPFMGGGGMPQNASGMGYSVSDMGRPSYGGNPPRQREGNDDEELLKRQAEIQASILNILQQSGASAQGQMPSGVAPQLGSAMQQPGSVASLHTSMDALGQAGTSAPRDPRLQAYGQQQLPQSQLAPGPMGQPQGPYAGGSPHMASQQYMPPQNQPGVYGGQGQPAMLSSSSNAPSMEKALSDLLMLKQKGFFDKRQ